MATENKSINKAYEKYYQEREHIKVYPTEFVVRTFLAEYPRLEFETPGKDATILDIGFGDGRNTAFLVDCGLRVSGTEITQSIVDLTAERLSKLGCEPDLRVGRNSSLPFDSNSFDYILACHSCYYLDEGQSMRDNLEEYARVLKKGGHLVASVPNQDSYIMNDANQLEDGSSLITNDPYNTRIGYRLHAFSNTTDIRDYFSDLFEQFSFGSSSADYYGIHEKVFWVVCQKR